ncbi:MAG TPA: hypothetical protein VGV59_08235 [Pyrinomonadaceae bacterium]|nr:hypothetical protein [Pyrinomonadaceae bacterium]
MSTFRPSIEDASEESLPVQFGGEVEIEDLSVDGVEGWNIQMPDATVSLAEQAGGTVKPIKASFSSVMEAPADKASIIRSLTEDKTLFRIVVLFVLVLLGLAFLAVVANDVMHDRMNFQTYTAFMLAFIVGRESKSITSKKTTNQGDGSG